MSPSGNHIKSLLSIIQFSQYPLIFSLLGVHKNIRAIIMSDGNSTKTEADEPKSTQITAFAATAAVVRGSIEKMERIVVKANSERDQHVLITIDGGSRIVSGSGLQDTVLDIIALKSDWKKVTVTCMYIKDGKRVSSEEVTTFGPQLVKGEST
ncbi:hypothetical protein PT974_12024 [Cladobotryum mycophilum]|uniref:Uncharacterized protein n=1 Tax=Cladobotryum mycophilum TaxID=491253 RepID=A0ABR0S7F0_9HYPO